MPKFENAADNILSQLSRTRAGHYSSIPIFQHSNWGGAPKFYISMQLAEGAVYEKR